MKCSNYVGETIDMAEAMGIRGILFIAHIGKFIKVSGGIMNTHSRNADARAELMAAAAIALRRRGRGRQKNSGDKYYGKNHWTFWQNAEKFSMGKPWKEICRRVRFT